MPRRRRPHRRLAIALIVGYLVVASLFIFAGTAWLKYRYPYAGTGESALPAINATLIATFFFVVGASVGSFLNVVVWRLPQGLRVNGSSFCPRCRNRLRSRDNVPILGWVWLGGRCRDCRLPISSRYPIVEAAVAVCFAIVGTCEIFSWNLPHQREVAFGKFDSIPRVNAGMLAILLFHFVGIAISWAMGLIRYDGNNIPSRLTGFAAIWLIGLMCLSPSLAIVPWQMSVPENWPPAHWWMSLISQRGTGSFWSSLFWQPDSKTGWNAEMLLQAVLRCLTALVAAGFFARVFARGLARTADLKADPLGKGSARLLDLTLLLSVVALLVGWQATIAVVVIASFVAVYALQRWLGERTDMFGLYAVALPITLTFQIAGWRGLANSGMWPSVEASPGVLLTAAGLALLAPLWLAEPQEAPIQPETPLDDSNLAPDDEEIELN